MAKTQHEHHYKVTAEENASAVFKRVGNAAAEAGRKVKEAAGPGGFGSLKKALGEESAIGNAMKALTGAGALAAVGMLGRSLNDATGKAAELAEQFARGEKSVMGMVSEMSRALPLIGNFVQAGDNLSRALNAQLDQTANALQRARDNIGNARIGAVQSRAEATLVAEKMVTDLRRDFIRQNGTAFERSRQNAVDANVAGASQLNQFDQRIVEARTTAYRAIGELESVAATTGDFARIESIKKELQITIASIEAEKAKVSRELAKFSVERTQGLFGALSGASNLFSGILDGVAKKAQRDAADTVRGRLESLGARRDAIREAMDNLRPSSLRQGATADAFTDFGASSLLAARGQVVGDDDKRNREAMQRSLKDIEKESREQTRVLKAILGKREGMQEIFQSIF